MRLAFGLITAVLLAPIVWADEKPFSVVFPNASKELLRVANDLKATLNESVRLENEVRRAIATYEAARKSGKKECCDAEVNQYLSALWNHLIFSTKVVSATDKYIDSVAEDTDVKEKIGWLKKMLRKSNIDLFLKPPSRPRTPQRPMNKNHRANFYI
jgi:hypothetical protein